MVGICINVIYLPDTQNALPNQEKNKPIGKIAPKNGTGKQ